MVGDKNKTRQQDNNNLAKLEASLAPAEAEVGAMAKADQYVISVFREQIRCDGEMKRSRVDNYW